MSTDAIPATREDAPTTELVTAAVGDRCAKCQAPLASDQRYCVNCGERRGRARFTPETVVTEQRTRVVSEPSPREPRFSSAASLVAGVATLLIAMGVGVLIGHYSNSSAPARAQSPQVITLGSNGAAANTTPTTAASTATARHSTTKKAKTVVVHVTAKTARAATAAASKVLGSSKNIAGNATQQVGGACSGGAGCQNGTFTGNYFPGG